MPVRAFLDDVEIFAFDFDSPNWDALKKTYKKHNLVMPCCQGKAIPKTSPQGLHFFAHFRKGACTCKPESQEHMYIKSLIAKAARNAGWKVTTEKSGETPAKEKWVADVYCTNKSNKKVAFEVQLSYQPLEAFRERQEKFKRSGVRCAWFISHSKFKRLPVISDKDLPVFLLDKVSVDKVPIVEPFNVPLPEFIQGMLKGNLRWVETPYCYQIYYFMDRCWKCGRIVKQVCGYSHDWYIEVAKTIPNASTVLQKVLEIISNSELRALGLNNITRIDKIRSKRTAFPFCNKCIYCGAPQSNYYLIKKLQPSQYEEEDTSRLKSMQFISPREFHGEWAYTKRS
ncbi:hypothetical protein D6779_03630 [Candidatus Parcubacteria bacterium]|nr:MAG: hypothetical protein D6779_03630 [Candidatus Parcubacteria bacterium]